MRNLALVCVLAAVFGLSFGCGGKDAKDKPATAVDTAAVAPDTDTTFTDKRDGKVYRIVEIGGAVWMAENLNYAAEGSRCYGNKDANCAKYGRLYDWNTAMTACPAGTHLSSSKEWYALVNYAGGGENAGTKLKSSTGWKNDKYVPAGTNEYGFSALPGGVGSSAGHFNYAGSHGYWWSASELDDAYFASYQYMYYLYKHVVLYFNFKTGLYSVRCVQDSKEGEQ